jgi:hypothetical protein
MQSGERHFEARAGVVSGEDEAGQSGLKTGRTEAPFLAIFRRASAVHRLQGPAVNAQRRPFAPAQVDRLYRRPDSSKGEFATAAFALRDGNFRFSGAIINVARRSLSLPLF